MLGVAILIIVLSVMEGFGQMWHKKIRDFSADVSITHSSGIVDDPAAVIAEIQKVEGITHAAPYVDTIALLSCNDRLNYAFVTGLEPDEAGNISQVPSNIIAGVFNLDDDNAVIGCDLAYTLRAGVGDTLLIYTPRSVIAEDEIHLPEEVTIAGIFRMGMWDYDGRAVITSISTAREIYGIDRGSVGVRATTDEPIHARKYADSIAAQLGGEYRAMTWMELKPDLLAALMVEKKLMLFLLAWISIVAFFCVASTIIVVTVQKTTEIGLLKALGFSWQKIMSVFVWYGMIQCIVGTVSGIASGLLIIHFRNHILRALASCFDWELFPKSIYQFDKLPAATTWQDVSAVSALVLVFCLLASVVPALRAATLNPAEAIRND